MIKWVPETKLLTLEQLVREWRTTPQKIHEWIAEGLPYVKDTNSKGLPRYQFNLKKCQKWYRQDAW